MNEATQRMLNPERPTESLAEKAARLYAEAGQDVCECGRGPIVGLLTVTASRVLFRTADEGTPTHDQGAADLRCLDCVADAVAEVASGKFRKRMREAGRRHRGAA